MTVSASIGLGETVVEWLVICAGVLVSVVLPPVTAYVRSVFQPTAASIDVKKYAALLLFSALTAALLLAFFRAARPDDEVAWYAALLAGYTWEATIEKIGNGLAG